MLVLFSKRVKVEYTYLSLLIVGGLNVSSGFNDKYSIRLLSFLHTYTYIIIRSRVNSILNGDKA